METLLQIALIIHIIAGMSALVCGLIALLLRKGSSRHKLNGNIFFYSMIGVAITALFISAFKSNDFLFYIGLFSLFMTLSGKRAIQNKTSSPDKIDILILILGFGTGIWMLAELNIVLRVFGALSLLLALGDVNVYYKVYRKLAIPANTWLIRHIRHMVGSYISTATAFLVVNIQFDPAWIMWLIPTAFGTPVIIYWVRKITPQPKKQLS
ncbi:MAG: DUF2306 domain-containing protein [Saprospiraceae bacterium]|nr:DUF2306 domain-containing protein [Saprospiraceae bacterium]